MAAFSDELEAAGCSPTSAVDAFIARCRLPRATTRSLCRHFIITHFPGAKDSEIRESTSQGYCSLTYLVGTDSVVQFRPDAHRLDVEFAGLARAVYGDLAPRTELIGVLELGAGLQDDEGDPRHLLAYFMTLVPGISLADFRRLRPGHAKPTASCGAGVMAQRTALVRDFAHLFSRSWERGVRPFASEELPRPKGLVGGSLRWRVERMHAELPDRFRAVTERILAALDDIERLLPWVLIHGDVVPSNIMVEAARDDDEGQNGVFRLSGMLDWAEAEYLPFGIGLYGLEELLGQTEELWDGTGPYPPRGSRFAHYPEAETLRTIFWTELEGLVPELRPGRQLREVAEIASELGILLWHGIAFDDGKLNRVVQEGKDDEEVQRLDLFLLGPRSHRQSEPGTRVVQGMVVADSNANKVAVQEDYSDDFAEEQPAVIARRRLSLSDAVKRAWGYLRYLRLPGPVFNKT